MAKVKELTPDQIVEITRCIYKPLEGQVFRGNVMDATHHVETGGPRFKIEITEEYNMVTTMENIRIIMEELFKEKVWKGITPGLLWVPDAPLGRRKLRVVDIEVVPLMYSVKSYEAMVNIHVEKE